MVMLGSEHGNYCGPGRASVYTPELKKRVIDMARKGVPRATISKKLDVPKSTVSDWCRRAEVKPLEEEPDMLHEFTAWMKCKMAIHGVSQNQLSKLTGLSCGIISAYLHETKMPKFDTAVKLIDALCELDGTR